MNEINQYTCADIRQLEPPRNVTKIGRILHQLGSGRQLNNRSAFQMGDTCLHSTIAKLRNDHAIDIAGESENFKGHDGHPSQRHRYWIEPNPLTLRATHRLLRLWGWAHSAPGAPPPIPKLDRAA